MTNTNNILKSFHIRISILTVIILISSIFYIYNLKKENFYKNFTNSIINIIQKDIKENEAEKDIYNQLIKEGNFIFFKIIFFDSNNKYSYYDMKIHKNYIKNIKNNSKIKAINNKEDYYNFIELPNNEYYMAFYHPIMINGKYIGDIEGITVVDNKLVSNLHKEIKEVILFILFVIGIFSATSYPIIYNAYKQLKEKTDKEILNNMASIKTIGNIIALRDSDTSEHNFRVTLYSIIFAKHLNLDKQKMKKLIIGAFIHDIGKIGIPDKILLKNEKLNDEEFKIMQTHVQKGVFLVQDNEWLMQGVEVIHYHHERYNGSGYPNGLKGSNIPLIARIFAIIDVFDALTSKRPYKEPYSYEKSIQIIKSEASTQFDPKLVEKFIPISKEMFESVQNEDIENLRKRLTSYIKEYFYL